MKIFFKIIRYLFLCIVSLLIILPFLGSLVSLVANDSIIQFLSFYYKKISTDLGFTLILIGIIVSIFLIIEIIKILKGLIKKTFNIKIAFNKFLYASIPILLFLVLFVFVDIFLFRGYFTCELGGRADKTSEADFTYEIKETENGWHFNIKNNELKFRYYWIYRNNIAVFNFSDSLFFRYIATRTKLEGDSTIFEDHWGFGCGTGLGAALIFPYEEFIVEYKNIYDALSMHYDLYYYTKYYKTIKSDSVNVRFFLPVFDFDSRIPKKVFSNPIKISYKNLLTAIEAEMDKDSIKIEIPNSLNLEVNHENIQIERKR